MVNIDTNCSCVIYPRRDDAHSFIRVCSIPHTGTHYMPRLDEIAKLNSPAVHHFGRLGSYIIIYFLQSQSHWLFVWTRFPRRSFHSLFYVSIVTGSESLVIKPGFRFWARLNARSIRRHRISPRARVVCRSSSVGPVVRAAAHQKARDSSQVCGETSNTTHYYHTRNDRSASPRQWVMQQS